MTQIFFKLGIIIVGKLISYKISPQNIFHAKLKQTNEKKNILTFTNYNHELKFQSKIIEKKTDETFTRLKQQIGIIFNRGCNNVNNYVKNKERNKNHQ